MLYLERRLLPVMLHKLCQHTLTRITVQENTLVIW